MASQTQGIQQLLLAEKKAAEKVNEARKRKQKRLKQAKDEAAAEIEKFRSEREAAFLEYEKKHMGSRDDIAVRIENETRAKFDAMNKTVALTKDKVIGELLERIIYDVKPELHKNLRLN
ncbi:V-type proton ATPase subunit G-like protein [Leptotrombidium deliense]|uniref:V-type proton ATPase subunit G n=1 Tax=Leptotrombidium deliense TaxID=299467 RepID=A0A443SV51_9ACAR|nr:V-type proton ATPase subunit G-like protein [Leptotrombidium deliense]